MRLAERVHANGVFVYLDQWDVKPGIDLPQYMETRIREAEFVLLICTPAFAAKANAGKGGVGYEKSIVTGEIFLGAPRETKFIPVLRTGDVATSIPSYLKSKVYVDLIDDARFDVGVEELLRHFHDVPLVARPTLGPKPNFNSERKRTPSSAAESGSQKSLANFDLAKFKELRDYAYHGEGLNLNEDQAVRWAEARMKDKPNFDLAKFKELRDYAYHGEGLNLNEDQAVRWAEAHMKDGPNFDLSKFKELRDYAYRGEGLNLNEDQAVKWAEAHMKDGPNFDLPKFKELRDYAYRGEGLNLNEEQATN